MTTSPEQRFPGPERAPGAAARGAARSGRGGPLRRAWAGLLWWAKGVTGESKYAAYVAHERRTHPDREPMSERAFWRDEYRRQGASPEGRCC